MNELGIVLVIVFAAVLLLTVFNRNVKKTFGKEEHSSSDPASPAQHKIDTESVTTTPSEVTPSPQEDLSPITAIQPQASKAQPKESEQLNQHGAKHFVLEVDDPNMTGELPEEAFAPLHQEPKFGRPESLDLSADEPATPIKQPIASAPEAKTFVLILKVNQNLIPMQSMHITMRGLGAKLTSKNIYKYGKSGEGYVTIANLMEPGTFPTENMDNLSTAGVVLILELPTYVAGNAAMYDMIILARKLTQRLDATIFDEKFQPVKESYLQSMRDQSLEYDSKRLGS